MVGSSEDWVGKYEGRGPGGSIQSLKFDEISPNRRILTFKHSTVGKTKMGWAAKPDTLKSLMETF